MTSEEKRRKKQGEKRESRKRRQKEEEGQKGERRKTSKITFPSPFTFLLFLAPKTTQRGRKGREDGSEVHHPFFTFTQYRKGYE